MMVLEFAIWGAWLAPELGDTWGRRSRMAGSDSPGSQIAWVGSAFAIASIVGIFFSSQFADRTFAAERFMAAGRLPSAAWRCSACAGPRISPPSSA